MQARILMAGALFSGALMLPAPPTASITARYKVAQRIQQDVDATALGGGKQGFVVKTTSYVLLTLTDTAGGRSVKVLVDSIHGDSLPPGAPADMLTKATGVTITGFVDPKGKLSNVKASSEAGGLQLSSLVQQLLPPLRSPLKVGDAWTDTTETSNGVASGTMTTRTVTNFKVTGTEARGAVKASKVDGAFSSSIAGSQETPGGSADIEGTGTGTSSYFVAPDGKLLGGTSNTTSNLNVTLAAQGATLPLVLSQSVEITPLP
ncbi:MAG: hypothetical protein H6Q77_70 [Gemmatimonadetes bacterium]|nr:hypothetical protein [Gemmatimonadota bacterium]